MPPDKLDHTGTTACESLNAAANIFLGQATAPFIIKPYLARLTLSEIHAIMTGGFATIAGTVLAAYIRRALPILCNLITAHKTGPAFKYSLIINFTRDFERGPF